MSLTKEQYTAFSEKFRDLIDSVESRGHLVELGAYGQLRIIEERTEVQVRRTVENHYTISAFARNEQGDPFAITAARVMGEEQAIVKLEDLLDQALNHAYGHNGGGAA